MKLISILCLSFFPALALAGTSAQGVTTDATPQLVSSAGDAINKTCPISGEPIDGKTFTEYDGHTIALCCAGCDKKFMAWDKQDRDAFVAASLAGGAKVQTKEASATTEKTAGDPYTLTTCPVSGEKLGGMGDPIAVDVNGRQVLVCCKGCIKKVQNDPKYLAAVDKQLIAEQKPYYPTNKCIVSGEVLEETGEDAAIETVVNNRLFRLCCGGCVKKINKNPGKYFALLDAEVEKTQGPNYPLATCIVKADSKLGAMGEPEEIVVGNRLVKFCCGGCKPKFEKDPASYLAKLDAAWEKSGKHPGVMAADHDDDHKEGGHKDGHGDHDH